jgi:hypothetical protein
VNAERWLSFDRRKGPRTSSLRKVGVGVIERHTRIGLFSSFELPPQLSSCLTTDYEFGLKLVLLENITERRAINIAKLTFSPSAPMIKSAVKLDPSLKKIVPPTIS